MQSAHRNRVNRGRSRGFSIIYVVIFFVVLLAFVSFAVDLGRVRVAKSQLQTASDAAARAGASALPEGPSSAAEDRAVEVAAANKCMNLDVALVVDEDIALGIWNPLNRTFHVLTDNGSTTVDERRAANACRVVGRRTVDRGNPLPMMFARILGKTTFNAETPAIAYITGPRRAGGLVGLDFVRMTGTTNIDSYNAATENYPGTGGPNSNATVSSNGDITLNGTVDIHGDAYPGFPDHIVDLTQNVTITGDWTAPLDAPLVFPAETVPGGLTNLGNFDLKNNEAFTLVGSNDANNPTPYWYSGFRCRGGSSLTVSGYVKLYVSGNLDLAGNVTVNSPGSPDQFHVSMTGANTSATVSGTSSIYVHLYAPLTDVTINGTPGFYGWVIGKSLTLLGNSEIHYDESLPMTEGPYTITLVK